MKKLSTLVALCITVVLFATVSCKPCKSEYTIIPMPNSLEPKCGTFELPNNVVIGYYGNIDSATEKVIENFASMLANVTGYSVTTEKDAADATISFTLDETLAKEAYTLDISKSKVEIKGSASNGMFYAIQTLKQLLPAQIYGKTLAEGVEWSAKCVTIEDAPRMAYRGNHLDVARHMFSVEEVKEFIDLMAMHKMNSLHWHITDDQGWRMESKIYPRLTEVGAYRNGTIIGRPDTNEYDNIRYGGFYSREEIKDIINYAAERQITIIPEVDMPGHMVAAVASYPHLGCFNKQCEVMKTWGISRDVLCMGKESTFEFVEDILTEVMELFPSEYIHIGGDECPKEAWAKCPRCQARIKAEGIVGDSIHSAEVYLQSYFNKRIEKFLNDNGRKMIGWDEILEGELSQSATVMSWRGVVGGLQAARKGHNVIMTPNTHLYFDYYQTLDTEREPLAIGGNIPVEMVYNYNPVDTTLTAEEGSRIIGVQANIWTEYIKDFNYLQYMLLPRLDALSEVAWTNVENKDWASFLKRLDKNVQVYVQNGNNFAKHILEVAMSYDVNMQDNTIDITLRTQGNAPIYYTLDGTEPTTESLVYKDVIKLNETATLKTFSDREGLEKSIYECTFDFNKATASKITLDEPICAKYVYDGARTLVDGLTGTHAFNTGRWIAFETKDLVANLDLGKVEEISEVSVGQLCDLANWIFPAASYKVEVSADGENFTTVCDQTYEIPAGYEGYKQERQMLEAKFEPVKAQYIKIKAESVKVGPEWHDGKNLPLFLFVDEIVVK